MSEHMTASEGRFLFAAAVTAPSLDRLASIEARIQGRHGSIVDGIRRRLEARLDELVAADAAAQGKEQRP